MSGDRVVRAMTDDGAFRIVAARTTDTVIELLRRQGANAADTRIAGELSTCAVLHRETMSPGQRVQCMLRGGDESGQLIAESYPDGMSRLLVRSPRGRIRTTGEGALISMQRVLFDGRLHTGTVSMPDDGVLANAMISYFDLSEQIATMVSIGTVVEGDRVVAAGGFLVQILAEAKDRVNALAVMSLRLEDFVDIHARLAETDASPDHLVEEVFHLMPHTKLGDSPLFAGCTCSETRVFTSLSTLDTTAIAELVASDEPLETTCDWCGTTYAIAPERLRGLLVSS